MFYVCSCVGNQRATGSCIWGWGGLSSFVTVGLYIESPEEVGVGRPLAHGIFKVLALKMKGHGID